MSAGYQGAAPRIASWPARFGVAVALNGISGPHRDYLAAGGTGFLLGDGRLNYGPETIAEAYGSWNIGPYVALSPDVQYIVNPGYNRDRGPAWFVSGRLRLSY